MHKIKKIIIASTLVAIAIGGWLSFISNKAKNYEDATVVRDGLLYKIEFKGVRYLMVHDPTSALMGKTYEANYSISVPRITGVVKGDEIPVKKGHYKYLGTITFTKNRFIVDLYYDDNIKDPISWNGEYKLLHNKEVK